MRFFYKFGILIFLQLIFLTVLGIQNDMLLALEYQMPDHLADKSEDPLLSKESQKLLKHLEKEMNANNAKPTSGEIQLSITMSGPELVGTTTQKQPKQTENLQQNNKRLPQRLEFVVNKHWDIVYRFNRNRKFFQIKEQTKVDSTGVQVTNVPEKHIEIEIENTRWQGRMKIGDKWRTFLPNKMPNIPLFYGEFYPNGWEWTSLGYSLPNYLRVSYKLSDFLRKFPPIDVQRVKTDKGIHHVITANDIGSYHNRTHKIWLDPQKGYRVTRILTHSRSTWVELNASTGDFTKTQVIKKDPSMAATESSERDHYTYQIAHFEPGIWFPQTATLFRYIGTDENQQSEHPYRKITMQIHKAVFNIPIDEKDLRFPD
ncbi:hypothetical protein F4X73_15520 [Candidatus Poribacteria bacterium]|nr:hypothetical protein [Candidatus Poribacteria bacterium]MYB66098.1 hypothetical protein [Candidatus Poribacteria bacterium]MYF55014.1 hypothetical protein [Candidatus Poribacteria bacterium]